ncbi:MerR family transcriptional regulator [Massilia norwichensis]|uniref:MerR family DNA-binding transcriptional regulator n=1 Tax=Massilia norwichensis TaxID=1442366 RepID=A0ABT2A1N6_9BURK|nr:MerR family transcriptional regulator [Massilia norwichensis]MCS0588104.1 MerR family DNA-binding transcriptional regulator [Massilia norwichensis]
MRYPKLEVNFKVKQQMKIGELAERSGIPASTIRYYEKEGLLPKAQRGANGYRVYQDDALARLDLIQLGQTLGFSLDTIRSIAALHGTALKDALLGQLDARLAEIDRLRAILDGQRVSVAAAKERVLAAQARGECRVQAAWATDECFRTSG